MPTRLSLWFFGGLTIAVNNKPLPKPLSRKARALLCYLVVTGRPHSRSALAGLLWSDTPEENARVNLRKELSRTRRLFDEFLVVDRETIGFNTDAFRDTQAACEQETGEEVGAWLDIRSFEKLLDEAAAGSVDKLREAIALYKGDFLDGFYVLNAPLFEEWILLQRGRLRERVLNTLQATVNVHLDQGNLAQAIDNLRQLIELEPWHEEAHYQLMGLLAENGQRAAALAQFEKCKQILDEELAVEPSAETQKLYEQIRNGEVSERGASERGASERGASERGASGKSAAPPTPQPSLAAALLAKPKHNLPAQTIPLVGRKQEVADVRRYLLETNARLVTILGPGGMGKTRLAQEVALSLVDAYEHGVFFVPLAPLSDSEPIISTIAENVGYTFDNEDGSLQKQLFEYLRPRNILLVLDNAEHILEGADLFNAILEAAPRVQIIVTSRERLLLMAETIFPLSGLPVAETGSGSVTDSGNLTPTQQTDAMQLFIQTGQRVCPDFVVDAANGSQIHQICRLVGGMPLGLILAGSWLETLTAAEIAAEIQSSLDFLAADFRDLPERQRSLQAIFNATWRQLSPDEQDVFKKLSIFQGDFTRDAAEAVAAASVRILTHLSYKSLLKRNGAGRYEIHEMLRQFALATLDEELPAVNNRHSDYYCTLLQQHEVHLKGADQQMALAEILADSQNVRAAWQWAIETQQLDNLLQSLESLSLFYLWQSRLEEGVSMWQRALMAFEMNPSTTLAINGTNPYHNNALAAEELRFITQASVMLCKFQRLLARLDGAQHALYQAKALLTHPALSDVATDVEQAVLLIEESEFIAERERQWRFPLIEESVTLFHKIGDDWNRAQAVDLQGKGFRETGQLVKSKDAIEAGLGLRQKLGDTRGIATSLANLGNTVANMGHFDEAASLYRQSIDLFSQINDRGQRAYQIFRLASALVHGGQFEEGFRVLNESIQIQNELGLPNEMGMNSILTGFALMHLGEYERAEASTIQAHLLTGRNTGYVKKDVGRIKLATGRDEEAQELLTDAVHLFRVRNDMNGLGQTLGSLGYLAIRRGDLQQARAYIAENVEIAARSTVYLPSLTAVAGMALLESEMGDVKRAVELYALALAHKHVANSQWFEDVAGQYIRVAAKALSPKVRQAAKRRGQARQLATTVEEFWEAKEIA